MNYIEWVLVRASALWRAQEETLKGRLAQSVPAAPAESGGARGGEEAAARLKRRLYGQTENDAAASELMADAEKAAAEAGRAAGALRSGNALKEESAAAWIAGELEKSTAAGASAAVRGEESYVRAAARESGGTETLALSLERDARRYDGGFLFY